MTEPVLLYVEDEDAAVFLLETALKESGLGVRLFRVADGEQALGFLNKSGTYTAVPTPDMILLDLNLPRITGLQLLEKLRHAGGRLSNIPVTVFTSSRLPADRRNALALGAKDFITKPTDLDTFMQVVRDACLSLVKEQSGEA
jgi:CheY-like chemotaxis protein